MTRVCVSVLLLPMAFALVASAQQPPEKKDPQSSFEPRSGPGAGQKFLAKFVGDWDVVKTFHPRSGEPNTVKGVCKQSMVHNGRFLNSEFVFGEGDSKTTGTGMIGFEPDKGVFTSVWTDSRQTRMSFRQGKDKFNGEEIIMYSQTLGDAGKETRRSRTNTRLEQDGNRIVHRQYSLATDGSERLVMELVMTRKTESAPPK
jgi:hypothetical protein